MKIKSQDLKRLYLEYIKKSTSSSRKNCLHPELILAVLRTKATQNQASEVIEHISHCLSCLHEFRVVKMSIENEKRLSHEVENPHNIKITNRGKINSKKNTNSLKTYMRFFQAQRPLKNLSIILIILTLLSVFSLFIFKRTDKPSFRSAQNNYLYLIHPKQGKYLKSSLVFEWNSLKSADYYILEIFDDTLYPIWKSDRIIDSKIHIPKEIKTNLIENTTYFWQITAYLKNGETAESRLVDFSVTQ